MILINEKEIMNLSILSSNTAPVIFSEGLKHLPFQIFGHLNVQELAQARLICQFWKKIVDEGKLWSNLLLKQKGFYFNPTNLSISPKFLLLDNHLTKVFKKMVQLDTPTEQEAIERKIFLEKFETIVLESLAERTVCFSRADGYSYYYRLSEKAINQLINPSTSWNQAVEEAVNEFISFYFSDQIIIDIDHRIEEYGNRIISSYRTPNKAMQLLIKEYRIIDIFKVKIGHCVITANRAVDLEPDTLNAVILEKDEFDKMMLQKYMFTLAAFMKTIKFYKVGEKEKGKVVCDNTLRKVILNILNSPTPKLKEYIEENAVKDSLFNVCKELIFRQVWHGQDANQGITFSIPLELLEEGIKKEE